MRKKVSIALLFLLDIVKGKVLLPTEIAVAYKVQCNYMFNEEKTPKIDWNHSDLLKIQPQIYSMHTCIHYVFNQTNVQIGTWK